MRPRSLWLGAWVCTASLLLLAALCSPAAVAASPLAQAARREDPRLAKPVTLDGSSLFLGELAERLTQQTGVSISVVGEGAADYRLCCAVRDRPLGDVLDALWSLMSYRQAEWHWERRKGVAGYSYCLLRTLPARRLAGELRAQIDEQFIGHYERMMRAVAAPGEPGPPADSVEGALLSSTRLRNGLKLFGRLLPDETRRAVLRSAATPRVSVNDLDAEGREFVESIWQRSINPSAMAALPRPEWIEFRTARLGNNVSPSLFIQVQGLGGYAYLGGDPLEKQTHTALDERWQLPGDLRPGDAAGIKELSAPAAALPQRGNEPLALQIRKLADELKVPILAYLPRGRGAVAISRPASLPQVLQQLKAKDPYLVSKVREGVLLLRYRAWFQQEEDPPALTWTLHRKVRKLLGEPEGDALLPAYCQVASLLTVPQLLAASEDYPLLAPVAFWREPLALYSRTESARRRLVSGRGVPLSELAGPTPLSRSPGLARALESGKFNSLRLVVEREESPSDWVLTLLLRSDPGEELPVFKLFPPKREGVVP